MDNNYQPNGNNQIADESTPVTPATGYTDQPMVTEPTASAEQPISVEPQPVPNYQPPTPVYQPPTPPYQQTYPVYQQPATAPVSNTKAIISMICGILGLTCCCGSLIPSLVAVILALVDRKDRGGKFSGMGTAGLVCGIIGLVLAVLSIIWAVAFSATGVLEDLFYEMYY